jgi:uncharacterized protein DUF4329/JAB domain-containing protein similar to deubiquitination enzymes
MAEPTQQPDNDALRAKLIATAAQSKMPTAALDPTSPWLPDLDTVVMEAIKRSGDIANNEQSGVIFKNSEGQYAYSIPLTSARQDDFALRAQIQKGHSLAAIWHSHPGEDDLAGYFSPQDLAMADQLKLPSYIRFNKDGSVRRYTPGKSATTSVNRGTGKFDQAKVSRGEPITAWPAQMYAESDHARVN